MAVIKAVSSKAGIGHAIDYVTKKEKTEEKLVSGLHCEPETVKEEMQATKELWGKTDGRTYKHYVQSYHEDEEITPEQAHKNAIELAEHTKASRGECYENYQYRFFEHRSDLWCGTFCPTGGDDQSAYIF